MFLLHKQSQTLLVVNYFLTRLRPLKAPEEDESKAENWELLLNGVSLMRELF